jgi:hypothetical protein
VSDRIHCFHCSLLRLGLCCLGAYNEPRASTFYAALGEVYVPICPIPPLTKTRMLLLLVGDVVK